MKKLKIILIMHILIASAHSQGLVDGILSIDPKEIITNGKISDLFESYSFIPLETSESIIIGRVVEAKVFNSNIYILSRTGIEGVVHIFSLKSGKLISHINKNGRGPGEYQFLTDFTVDKEGFIFLLDGKSVLKYKSDGTFIEKYKISIGADKIISTKNGNFVLNSPNGSHEISLVNEKFELMKVYFPFEINRIGYSNILQRSKSSCIFYRHNYGSFYRINSNNAVKYLEILVDGYKSNKEITQKAINDINKKGTIYPVGAHNLILEDGFLGINLLINECQLYGLLMHGKQKYILRYSIKSGKYELFDSSTIVNDITGDSNNFDHKILTPKNELICFIKPYKLRTMKRVDMDQSLFQLTKNLDDGSNPVIFIGKLNDLNAETK